MDADGILAVLGDTLPDARLETAATVDLHPTIVVQAGDVARVARALRDDPRLDFSLLAELTAVDFLPRAPRFEVVYHLVSIEGRRRLRLKVRLDGEAPRLRTVSDVWPAANWLEREVWDLFGIDFGGHPDLRRLLMPEDWSGFPLRKDFPVQINQPVRTSSPTQLTSEEFKANVLRDRRARE